MRRADRLFQIIQILRRRKLARGAEIAAELEVSPRTIYRDIADLIGSGVPISGEAGIGYRLDPGFDLPPLHFTPEELEVLTLGAALVANLGDPALARTASDVLAKIAAMVPKSRQWSPEEVGLLAPPQAYVSRDDLDLAGVRLAIRRKRKLRLDYFSYDEQRTRRKIWPLCISFFGSIRLISGWCELRNDFRSFRADRIQKLEILDEAYPLQRGRTLADFRKRLRERPQATA